MIQKPKEFGKDFVVAKRQIQNMKERRRTAIPGGEPTEFQKMFNQHLNKKPPWGWSTANWKG